MTPFLLFEAPAGLNPCVEVIKREFVLRLKIKRYDWLLADTCPQAANHCALLWVCRTIQFVGFCNTPAHILLKWISVEINSKLHQFIHMTRCRHTSRIFWNPVCVVCNGQKYGEFSVIIVRFNVIWTMKRAYKNDPDFTNSLQLRRRVCVLPDDKRVDWLQSLKQFFINVSYNILVASLTPMALFWNRAIRVRLATSIWYDTLMKKNLRTGASLINAETGFWVDFFFI